MSSAARAERRREARYEKKLDQYVETNFWPMPNRRLHGVCRRCSRRTYLWRPTCVCNGCIEQMACWVWAANFFGVTL